MSVASPSIPRMRISPSSSCSSPSFGILFTTRPSTVLKIRSSQADGPIRRPVAPASPALKPVPPQQTKPVPPPPTKPVAVAVEGKSVTTIEFQRQKARELQEYFKQKKAEEAAQGPFFGFQPKNEISNGRWAMFGFPVGMLTEYATGSILLIK